MSLPFSGVIEDGILFEFKEKLFQLTPAEVQDIIQDNFPFYDVVDNNLMHEFNILFIIYGFLSYHLQRSGICKLVIKGGKVLQQWHAVASNDIDVMLVPANNVDVSDMSFISIGRDICTFMMWIISGNFNWSVLDKTLPTDVRSIYKISKISGIGFTALSDIGVGYNHLEKDYIQPLYLKDCPIAEYPIGERIVIQYFPLCKSAFINEKVYYTIYYYLMNSTIHSYDHVLSGGQRTLEFEMNNSFIHKSLQQLTATGILSPESKAEFRVVVRNVMRNLKSRFTAEQIKQMGAITNIDNIMVLFELSYNNMNMDYSKRLESYIEKRTPTAKGRKFKKNKNITRRSIKKKTK
jgi:hypothetical protein